MLTLTEVKNGSGYKTERRYESVSILNIIIMFYRRSLIATAAAVSAYHKCSDPFLYPGSLFPERRSPLTTAATNKQHSGTVENHYVDVGVGCTKQEQLKIRSSRAIVPANDVRHVRI